MAKIYTKTGDKGRTRLADGRAVGKDHPCLAVYGDLDELNAALGWALAQGIGAADTGTLASLQSNLLELGAAVAGGSKKSKTFWNDVAAATQHLEQLIDEWDRELPPLKTFVLPGGSAAGAALHVARTVCRRAERSVAALYRRERVSPEALAFLNRLSDFLFVLARRVNEREFRPELPWKVPLS